MNVCLAWLLNAPRPVAVQPTVPMCCVPRHPAPHYRAPNYPVPRHAARTLASGLSAVLVAMLVTVLAAVAAAPAPAHALPPSFDCAKARGQDERAICADAQLSQLDVDMTTAYYAIIKMIGNKGVRYNAWRADQADWIKERGRCADTKPCLQDLYRQRIAWLSHPLNTVSGEYTNDRYSVLLLWSGLDNKPLMRLYNAGKPSDTSMMAMELQSRWVNATDNKGEGEDAVYVTPSFSVPHRKLEGLCSALRFNFGTDGLVMATSNDGCPLFKDKAGKEHYNNEMRLLKPVYSSPRPVR